MLVTMWILFIGALVAMLLYLAEIGEIAKHNQQATIFGKRVLDTGAKVGFWIAFITFAITAGIIFGGMWR
jgi:hypothetical protein